MRLLVTGAAGMLGRILCAWPKPPAMTRVGLAREDVDITDLARSRRLFARRAARRRHQLRRDGPTSTAPRHRRAGRTRRQCRRARATSRRRRRERGAWIVQISTDYVFDGSKRSPYVESDPPSPLSSYGTSKLAGEREVVARCPDMHTIAAHLLAVRDRPLLSGDDHAPGRRARRAHDRRRPGRLSDVHRPSGRGPGRADRRARAAAGSRAHGGRGVVLVVRARARGARRPAGVRCELRPGDSADLARPARRPAYSVLATEWGPIVPRLPDWREGVAEYMSAGMPAA